MERRGADGGHSPGAAARPDSSPRPQAHRDRPPDASREPLEIRLGRGPRAAPLPAVARRVSFLLDYLPGFNEAYRPAGFIQYQLFVPRDAAEAAFRKALLMQHEMGVVSSLAVIKRHRADPSPRGYVLDGFSLAMDFAVTRRSASRLVRLCRAFYALLLQCGGH